MHLRERQRIVGLHRRMTGSSGGDLLDRLLEPQAAVEPLEIVGQRAQRCLTFIAGQQRRLILYVEDNPANVRFMRDLVSSLDDIELVTALTAEMGVEIACERLPQVIIMDINLPGMSGLDALRLLRGRATTRDIPVIALTAAASERDRQRGLAAGFCQYLTKPVKVDELVTSLEALLTSPSLEPSA